MVELQESVQIALPAGRVWALIADPVSVASCLTGATLEATDEPGLYRGTMRVKFGPTVVSFLGEARMTYDHAARVCTIEGRGHDKRGISNATATITVSLQGDATSELSVGGGFAMSGPLEGFARTGGVHIARILLKDFAANIARQADAAPVPVPVPAPDAAAGEAAASSAAGEAAASSAATAQPATQRVQQPVPPPMPQALDASGLAGQATRQWAGALIGRIAGFFRRMLSSQPRKD